MLPILIDENFDHRIIRGLRLRLSELDYLVVQQIGMSGIDDPALLDWAAKEGRVIVTHDVNTSPDYNANYMDSMLILHAGKWIFAEFLRLAWNQDRKVIAETIAQLVQLEHSLIHELDGKPLVLAKGISAPSEILLLLNHASNNRLSRVDIEQQAHHHKPTTLAVAITRLIDSRDIRDLGNDEVALTPNGQRRVMQEILPKYNPT
jgi:Domain of unknown function (DUF5615)